MHHFKSADFIPFSLAVAIIMGTTAVSAESADYKLADQNFYQQASVVRADAKVRIFRRGEYRHETVPGGNSDSYSIQTHGKAPKEIYVEVVKEWLEPVTPPTMPESLGLAPDVMQIREPQGDVQVAPPDNPTGFVPATEGMPVSNGSVIKTGANGTAAVLFGGVNSTRLTPGSEAMVQQTVMPDLRSTRIDLKFGVVFSKVGLRHGEKQDFQVHTPFGVAFAKGTDFVCAALPDRTDVWVAQGTVQFEQPSGLTVGVVTSPGNAPLKVMRFPAIKDAQLALAATTQTLTTALDFIPTVNLKLKTLHDQAAQGIKMTPEEIKYLTYIKHVPCLIKLALVEPPPAPVAAAAPVPSVTPAVIASPVPAASPAPMAAAAPEIKPSDQAAATPMAMKADSVVAPRAEIAAPEPQPTPVLPVPSRMQTMDITVLADGSIHFQGEQLSSGHLERKLAQIAKKNPDCAVAIRGSQQWQADRIKTVIAMCHQANVQNVTVVPPDSSLNSSPEKIPVSTSAHDTSP